MIDEIGTKLKMMQRERDKYEDLIEEEVEQNKVKRIECINLNMKITSHEARLLSIEAKFKDMQIQNQTLKHQLSLKKADTDSKKVKELKNTVWQFNCEKEEVWKAVDETKAKMRLVHTRTASSKDTVSRLSIELGELKIILENMQEYSNDDLGKEA